VSPPIPHSLRQRPFLVREGLAAGLTHNTLRGPQFWTPFRGVRVCADIPDTVELRARAATLVLPPNAVLSHCTAAALFHLPARRTSEIHAITAPGRQRTHVAGIREHRLPLSALEICKRNGLRVTRPERTWLDLAAGRLSDEEVIAVGDAVLHKLMADVASLESFIVRAGRRPGSRRAREALEHMEPRTESPAETWLRLTLVRGGLPRPLANHDVHDSGGGWVARPDFLYADAPVVIQYDGLDHFTDPRRRRGDVMRDELCRDLGYEIVVITADYRRDPHRVVGRVGAARDRARGRRATGFVRDPWPEKVALTAAGGG